MATDKGTSRLKKLSDKVAAFWQYCSTGVWSDTRQTWWVNVIKTLNITVKSFLNTDIQSQACALTYRTLLAIVPALALLFAIGRGFGFQNLLQDELYNLFPGQQKAINHALIFVDSYLNQASEGIFVGVGIVFLLWTLISLVSSVEDSFNLIWNIKQGRSLWRKITDYTAMFLILPVLMICGSGLTIFVSSTLQQAFNFKFMTPLITMLFEFGSYAFTWLFFTAVFMLIPNTKVKFGNALIAGVFTGTAFLILQWLFVSGQLYVSKYNAIYGSFSFLPLLLLWLQLVWVICLTGALICYASQNIFQFSFSDKINKISREYNEKVTLAIATTIVQRFVHGGTPVTIKDLIVAYGIPSRLASDITDRLMRAGIVSQVVIDEKHELFGFQPAIDPATLTVNVLRQRLNRLGYKDFIPNFDKNFRGVISEMDKVSLVLNKETTDTLLSELKINPL